MTFWGTLVANDAKIVHFTFYIYFTGALQAKMFLGAMRGPPLDTHPVQSRVGAGPKIEWAGVERGVKNMADREWEGCGAVSGGYRKRCERWAEISTAPAPLTCCGKLCTIPRSLPEVSRTTVTTVVYILTKVKNVSFSSYFSRLLQ